MLIPASAKTLLIAAFATAAAAYAAVLLAAARRARRAPAPGDGPTRVTAAGVATGAVANFFDTLGVGSFATTTAIFRHWRLVRDEWIPGTLNAGHTLPTVAQALIYTQLVPVDGRTLVLMIGAAVAGAWLGAGLVSRLPRRAIQLGMGVALAAAAVLLFAAQFALVPAGGTALGLAGTRLVIATAGNFALGALMTLGIGLYAPCLMLVSVLGMNPTAAFPIMMGSCALLMPVASARFVRARTYHPGMALGMALGGIPAVLVAAFIVKSLPLTAVRYLVVAVVLYTALGLVRAAMRERAAGTVKLGVGV